MGVAAGTDSLEDLLQRCRAGDAGGFTAVYRRYGRMLYGTALRMLGRPEDAEDAVQETFIRFCRKVAELEPEQLPSWLRRVLVNLCLDQFRRRRSRAEEELEPSVVAGASPRYGLGLDLRTAVAKLPERARLIFLLHDVEGFKHREIAALLDLSEGSTKSQLFRARELLRGAITAAPRSER